MALPMLALVGAAIVAQAPPAAAPVASPATPALTISLSVERRVEHYDYRFDHPSTFDTVALVPHFFEQHYDAGNTWLLVSASYRFLGAPASTEVGFTPRVTTFGSDIDTFFQPSGDVVTSGSRGDVRLRSFSVDQRFGLARWRDWTFGVALGYRRSRADFPPDDRIITHSIPPSETREFTTDRETTVSRVIASGLTARARWRTGARWQVTLDADVLPITRSRLVISLPDKYPGQDIVGDALAFGAKARVTVERRSGHLTAGVAVTTSGAWGYRSTAHYHQQGVGVAAFVGVGR